MSEHDPVKKRMREERDRRILARLQRGERIVDVAQIFGVDEAVVSEIRRRARMAIVASEAGKAAPEGHGAGSWHG